MRPGLGRAHNAVRSWTIASLRSAQERRLSMLEHYFARPETVDRIRSSWIAPAIEKYVSWLVEHRYGVRNIWRRVPLLVEFGEFARRRGARSLAALPSN